MHKYSNLALQGAPWSVTKADTAMKCPQKYHFQYVERVKPSGATVVELDDAPLRIGSAAHSYAEGVAKNKPAKMVLRQVTRKNRLSSTEQEKLGFIIEGVDEFLERVEKFKSTQNIGEDLIEGELAFTADGKPSDYWSDDAFFRWKVDRQLVSVSKESVAVLDLKTGSASLRWSQDQLNAYAHGAFALYPEAKVVRAGLFSAQDGAFIWADPYRREDDKDSSTPGFLEEAATRTTLTDPGEGRHCDWCPYQKICPAKQ